MAKNEVIIAFDLSTTCTGVAIAYLKDNSIAKVKTLAIQPGEIDIQALGFLPKRKKVNPKKGSAFNAYVKYQGEIISKTEKKRRDSLVRQKQEEHRINFTCKEIYKLLIEEKPDIILMETNMSFRNMRVTKILAEVAGALQALATSQGIPIHKINVHSARAKYNIYEETKHFAKQFSAKELKQMDVTKEALKNIMLRKFKKIGASKGMTTDESDALVLLDYWISNT